jgi:shikimate dehydrogenase
MKRIILTGPRGSGKSTIGPLVARECGVPYVDTDEEVVRRTGQSVEELFEREGEDVFRKCESAVIEDLPEGPLVVATGGGAVCRTENVRALRRDAMVFFLLASPAVLAARTKGSTRPPLTGLSHDEEVAAVLGSRLNRYRAAADVCLRTDEQTPDTLVRTILDAAKKGPLSGAALPGLLSFLATTPMEEPEFVGMRGRLDKGTTWYNGLFAVIGNPCMHSKSPALFNPLFAKYRLDAYYTCIQHPDITSIMAQFTATGMKGLSVTIPFKQEVIRFCDDLTPDAEAIGAVNTVVQCGGGISGSNTDWLGIRRPLEDTQPGEAVVFGAGGAAYAAIYALQSMGCRVTVLNRTPGRAREAARLFDCAYGVPGDYKADAFDIIINATSVGMGGAPPPLLLRDRMHEGQTVFDLVYTPPETPLIREARAAGCTCIPGTELFVHQACAQFERFTGITIGPDEVRELIL